LAAQKERSGTNKTGLQPPDETLGDLYQLAKTQVEERQEVPRSRSRWNALLVIEIIACLLLGSLALRWYRASSTSIISPESHAFIQGAHQAAARVQSASAAALPVDPTPTAVPPTPVLVSAPSSIPGLVPQVFVPMVWRGPGACKSAEEINFELVSGPVLEPVLGTRLQTKQPPDATATWTIRNLGECQWDSLGIYSVYRSLLHQPQIRRGGELFDTVAGLVVANPGETLEITAAFPGDQASEVNDEWVLVINGHQFFSKTHLYLNVAEWLVVENPEPKYDDTSGTSSGSGSSSGQTSPIKQPQRPTEGAPVRP